MSKKIIIAATFRDFDGKTNDKIQRLFLQSLKDQTHKDFTMAVTVFREKGVPEALAESGLPHTLYFDNPVDYKFSLSVMLLNAIDAGKKYPDGYILLWVNADNMLEPDFLERVARCDGPKVGGLVYPHVEYSTMENYRARKHGRYAWYGIDCAFFTSDTFTDKCVEAMKKYAMYDYLYFEFLMTSMAKAFCDTRVNLWPRGYNTVSNDYAAVSQTRESVKVSGLKNMVKLKAFCKEFGVPEGDWYHSILQYKVTGNSPGAYLMATRIYFHEMYADSYIRKVMPKLKRMLGLSKF